MAEFQQRRHHLVEHRRRHRLDLHPRRGRRNTPAARVETATDSGTGQSGTSTSAATAAVADIVLAFTSAASISGSATVGSVLTAVNGALNDADAAVTGYQWQSSSDNGSTWSNIAGATSATYTPVTADAGKVLRVVETATDTDGGPSTTSNSPATSAVTNNSLVFTTPASITGTAQEGSVLTAVNGTTNDPNAVDFRLSMAEFQQWRHHLVEHRRRHRHNLHPRRGRRDASAARRGDRDR